MSGKDESPEVVGSSGFFGAATKEGAFVRGPSRAPRPVIRHGYLWPENAAERHGAPLAAAVVGSLSPRP
jgi:hypothetical protein